MKLRRVRSVSQVALTKVADSDDAGEAEPFWCAVYFCPCVHTRHFHFLLVCWRIGFEGERGGVDAVAQSGGGGAIGKDMP